MYKLMKMGLSYILVETNVEIKQYDYYLSNGRIHCNFSPDPITRTKVLAAEKELITLLKLDSNNIKEFDYLIDPIDQFIYIKEIIRHRSSFLTKYQPQIPWESLFRLGQGSDKEPRYQILGNNYNYSNTISVNAVGFIAILDSDESLKFIEGSEKNLTNLYITVHHLMQEINLKESIISIINSIEEELDEEV